mmetsp:Transcript_38988/g.115992  ORF Transcript_38988/g.115992 Transcript_38988/m.115992 type:complete len:88 (+) Transcript_38988:32-295(+)
MPHVLWYIGSIRTCSRVAKSKQAGSGSSRSFHAFFTVDVACLGVHVVLAANITSLDVTSQAFHTFHTFHTQEARHLCAPATPAPAAA